MALYRYIVLGSGRQGTAAAYDLALRGDAREIVLADASAERAREAATWITRGLPREKADLAIAVHRIRCGHRRGHDGAG